MRTKLFSLRFASSSFIFETTCISLLPGNFDKFWQVKLNNAFMKALENSFAPPKFFFAIFRAKKTAKKCEGEMRKNAKISREKMRKDAKFCWPRLDRKGYDNFKYYIKWKLTKFVRSILRCESTTLDRMAKFLHLFQNK